MYKFIAEKADGNGTVTNTRTFEATSYTSSRHASGKSGDVTIQSAEGLHTPINVSKSDWQYVRVFDAAGILVESMTFANGMLFRSARHTADRP